MWTKISLPTPPNKIRAYTHANAGALFVVTRIGLYALRFERPIWRFVSQRVEETMLLDDDLITYDPYGAFIYRETYFAIHGYPTDDSEGCSDIPLGVHSHTGDHLEYDPSSDSLHVRDAMNSDNIVLSVRPFGVSEESWASAGFSNDGMQLTVANLERILVFGYTKEMAEQSDADEALDRPF